MYPKIILKNIKKIYEYVQINSIMSIYLCRFKKMAQILKLPKNIINRIDTLIYAEKNLRGTFSRNYSKKSNDTILFVLYKSINQNKFYCTYNP